MTDQEQHYVPRVLLEQFTDTSNYVALPGTRQVANRISHLGQIQLALLDRAWGTGGLLHPTVREFVSGKYSATVGQDFTPAAPDSLPADNGPNWQPRPNIVSLSCPGHGHSPVPDAVYATCPCATLVKATASLATDTAARWRVVPAYGDRPFTIHACCSGHPSTVPSEALAANGSETYELLWWAADILRSSSVTSLAAFSGLTVTVRSTLFIQDYRTSLLRLIGGILSVLRLMLVLLLAALAHQPRTTIFLLVMLAAARHYGRRGEPDHYLPGFALNPVPSRGVVRLAA